MIRKLYFSSSVLSAVMLAALGIGSLWRDVGGQGRLSDRHWARARIVSGNVHLAYARPAAYPSPRKGITLLRGSLGYLGLYSGSNQRWQWVAAGAPLWVPVGALLVHPAVAFVLGPVRRRRRARKNQCSECGYDLIGSLSGRCSECGHRFSGGGSEAYTLTRADGPARAENSVWENVHGD